jgi:hypothetical protein
MKQHLRIFVEGLKLAGILLAWCFGVAALLLMHLLLAIPGSIRRNPLTVALLVVGTAVAVQVAIR